MRPNFQRFATVNCQGFNDKVKQTHIADYFYKWRLATIMVNTYQGNKVTRIHFI